ncbi:MAG: hypothetical protein MJ147_10260 [Clostridia bacterium]|nr:hypothetical protein [Clostridia bacterium]
MKIKEKGEKLLKNKKLMAIIAACLVVLIVAVCLIVHGIRSAVYEKKINSYLDSPFETYGEMNIIADSADVDSGKNSLAGIKEAHRLGADTVTLDLCFNSNDVPVITDDYDSISKSTLKLEDVFKLLTDSKYSSLRVNLRIRQLGSLKKFNELFSKYDVSGRVMLSGIDKDRYALISGESTPAALFFDYTPKGDAKKSLNEILSLQKEYGISGVIIDLKDMNTELSEKLNQRGIIYIVSGADEEMEMYSVLGSGASNIETAHPDQLKEVCFKWKESTRENMDKSILNELNNKKLDKN